MHAGTGQHRLYGLWIKPTGGHFLPKLMGRVVERPRGTIWPRLQHGLARIGGREHAGATIEVGPPTAAMIWFSCRASTMSASGLCADVHESREQGGRNQLAPLLVVGRGRFCCNHFGKRLALLFQCG